MTDLPIDDALLAKIADMRRHQKDRVFALVHEGRKLWIKTAATPRHRLSLALQRAGAILLGLAMLRPPRELAGSDGLAAEAGALRELLAANWPVPPVLGLSPYCLVLGDAGHSVERWLNVETDRSARRERIAACADLLRRLHEAGFWHGGAQIRNFYWAAQGPGLLDMEDHDLPGMTLPEKQARDLLLFLYSLIRYEAAADPILLPIARNLIQAAAPEVRQALAKLHRRLGPLIRALKPLAPHGGRDLRQVIAAELLLREALA